MKLDGEVWIWAQCAQVPSILTDSEPVTGCASTPDEMAPTNSSLGEIEYLVASTWPLPPGSMSICVNGYTASRRKARSKSAPIVRR